ncbi:MAG: hypothetical protein J6A59_01855 [Lachnospiraceae bacterium]|nr:hypothetical protein [Lachnospiraceae bacterium]
MSDVNAIKELYNKCKELDAEDTMELALNAETEEEQRFIEMISDYILQLKQKEVVAQGKF